MIESGKRIIMTTEVFGAVSYERMEEHETQSSISAPCETQPSHPESANSRPSQPQSTNPQLAYTDPSQTVVAPPMASQPVVAQATTGMTAQGYIPQAFVVQPNQPIILNYNKPKRSRVKKNYKGKMSKVLGLVQIMSGIMAIACQITAYCLQIVKRNRYHNSDVAYAYYSWFGVWCGVFMILGGTFAFVAGKYKHICLIISAMIICIFSALFGVITIGLSAWAVEHDRHAWPYWYTYGTTPPNYQYVLRKQEEYTQGSLAVGVLIMISGVVSFVSGIVTSALCCAVGCCCASDPDNYTGQVLYMNPGGAPAAGLIQIPQTSGISTGAVAPTYYVQQGSSLQPVNQVASQPPPYSATNHAECTGGESGAEAMVEKTPLPD